jgi:molecular chaperone GrpE
VAEQQSSAEAAKASSSDGNAQDTAKTVLEDLEKLRARAAERDQFLDLLRRTQADFENYQKRNQREREQERRVMAGSIVRDMIPILDNLERALTAAKEVGETGPLVQGVGMVQSQFLNVLQRYGVTPIEAQGQVFDPMLHEAVAQQPAAGQPPNKVLHVVERGFMIDGRVLRPAKVVVSQA